MKKLNNKGFTLVEVIAVVVILAVLAMLLVPSVTSFLDKSETDSYKKLKQSILVAAKEFVNDNRYNTELECVPDSNAICFGDGVLEGNITVKILLEEGYLSPSGTEENCDEDSEVMTEVCEYVVDPRDRNKRLVLADSYVIVSFNSAKRDYEFKIDEEIDRETIEHLEWQ